MVLACAENVFISLQYEMKKRNTFHLPYHFILKLKPHHRVYAKYYEQN